ncbi:hypothetical protein MES5069_310110 [Mesorhizobium escarrei]|uniref:ATP-dependent DNA ligase n=1 Tax=Mesorhizobium escarrei TaxID=666018 RepID=A0ABM9DZZ4_9HYPH|nr:hypothetical protein MES5069_310110 [Mesorhizobium escarrei]
MSVNREMRERLWKRVQEHAGPKRPATQWVKPGIKARVKHLRGEEDLRHASLQDFWDEESSALRPSAYREARDGR